MKSYPKKYHFYGNDSMHKVWKALGKENLVHIPYTDRGGVIPLFTQPNGNFSRVRTQPELIRQRSFFNLSPENTLPDYDYDYLSMLISR